MSHEFPIDQPNLAETAEQAEAFARHSARLRELEERVAAAEATQAQDDLEQGGVWHADGILPCATGRPYPHQNTTECRMVARPAATFREQREAFELPTVATLNRRITELTHERDHLAAKLEHAPTDLDHAAVCAERDDLRQKLVALDRARLTLAATAHGLLGALDEGDLDTPAYVERMREALTALTTDNIRMTLTDKGIEAVTAGPVTRVAQETEPEAGSRSTPTEQVGKHHNGQYGVAINDHGSDTPRYVKRIAPNTASVSDVGETTLLPLPADHYKMATRAHHSFAGDISRDEPSLAVIYGEIGDVWIGEWVTGIGYVNVRFPKATTRELTAEEIAHYDGLQVEAGNGTYKIRITEENPR